MDNIELEYIPVDVERQSVLRIEIVVDGDGKLEIVANELPREDAETF